VNVAVSDVPAFEVSQFFHLERVNASPAFAAWANAANAANAAAAATYLAPRISAWLVASE